MAYIPSFISNRPHPITHILPPISHDSHPTAHIPSPISHDSHPTVHIPRSIIRFQLLCHRKTGAALSTRILLSIPHDS
ncbi:hypothetical protein DW886_18875 [Enterocloster aldenensis]|nr:hypothetical protein DW886_18875 [Enterocloster aldenensis]